MKMKLTGNDRIWGLATAGVMLSFFIWGFQGSGPLIMLAIIPYILLVLSLAVPSKYQPHLFSSVILIMAGVLVGVSLEKLLGNIPYIWWAVCAWPLTAAAAGLLRPFPFLKKAFPLLRMTAAGDAGKNEGRGNVKNYRPQVIPILVLGLASTIGTAVAHLFSLYGPDLYGSRKMSESFGPVGYAFLFWIGSALSVLRFGPFKTYLSKDREDGET